MPCREFAMANANTVYGTGKMTLPNSSWMPLEPNDDVETWNKLQRVACYADTIPAPPPISPSPPSTTAPATTPAKTRSRIELFYRLPLTDTWFARIGWRRRAMMAGKTYPARMP